MPKINVGDIVKPPVQTEPMTEDYRGVPVAKRTWYRFFLELFYRGYWNDVAYDSTMFTGNGTIVWTVDSGDQVQFGFTQIGKTIIVAFWITTTTVAGVGSELWIALPFKHTNNRKVLVPVHVNDNGTHATGYAYSMPSDSVLRISKVDGSNWSAATNTTGVVGEVALEIEG